MDYIGYRTNGKTGKMIETTGFISWQVGVPLVTLHQPKRGVRCRNKEYRKRSKHIKNRFQKIYYKILLKMDYHIK